MLPLMCLTFLNYQLIVMSIDLTVFDFVTYYKFDFNLLLNFAVLSILQTFGVPFLLAKCCFVYYETEFVFQCFVCRAFPFSCLQFSYFLSLDMYLYTYILKFNEHTP